MYRWSVALCLCLAYLLPSVPAHGAPVGQEQAVSFAVFGVRGTFAPGQASAFTYGFTTTDGLRLTVAGSTPVYRNRSQSWASSSRQKSHRCGAHVTFRPNRLHSLTWSWQRSSLRAIRLYHRQ